MSFGDEGEINKTKCIQSEQADRLDDRLDGEMDRMATEDSSVLPEGWRAGQECKKTG